MSFDQQKTMAIFQRVFGDLSANYAGVMTAIGDKLGLYRAMEGAGQLTSAEVAERANCAERYIREWLNSQVAGGYIDYDGRRGTYELCDEHAAVLADDNSPTYLPVAWDVVASMWADLPKSLSAFKTGEGVGWGDHDARMYCGVAGFFRNAYQAFLVSEWLPAVEGIIERLQLGARVADIGCGHGHSTVIMAEAFPNSKFWGFDTHAPSLEEAAELAADRGVDSRVRFERADAASQTSQKFDLICFFDCLHDMGNPVDAARSAAESLTEDGTVMLIEPFARDRIEDNVDAVGRLYYSASSVLCCPHAVSERGTHVLGAQAGEARLRQIFEEAGFRTFRRAAETPFNLILEARR